MKLHLVCPDCFNSSEPDEPFGQGRAFVEVEVRDDGAYFATCREGHQFITFLIEERFEVLFELGVHAIVDGYYREAVTSFTASLERFYEYALRIMSQARGVQPDTFDKFWKQISNQSERQVGAYAVMHLIEFGKPMPMLPSDRIAFRNAVVHKGKIPSSFEALDYGEQVRVILVGLLADLVRQFQDSIASVFEARKVLRPAGAPEAMDVNLQFAHASVSLFKGREAETLQAGVAALRAFRDQLGHSSAR